MWIITLQMQKTVPSLKKSESIQQKDDGCKLINSVTFFLNY